MRTIIRPRGHSGVEGDVVPQGHLCCGQTCVDRTRQNAIQGRMQASGAIVIV
jgi:hypothetical protein